MFKIVIGHPEESAHWPGLTFHLKIILTEIRFEIKT